MTYQDFTRLLEKIDGIENCIIELTDERDRWKKMYYDLKGESEKLMKEVKNYLQTHKKLEHNTHMKEFEKMMKGWNKLALKLADYGAFDTEPRQVMEFVIEEFINKGTNLLPLKANRWQLYSFNDSEDAATQLNEYTQKIIDLLDGMKHSELMEIKEYYGY